MAALIKELLLDYALNKVSLDLKSDLSVAIQSALLSDVFIAKDAIYLNLYLSGYTAKEIADIDIKTTEEVETVLERVFTAIEYHSGYTDESFIHKLESTNKYRRGNIRDLTTFLQQHSKTFLEHDIAKE